MSNIKLESPLKNLVNRCQTICVAECCGLNAYDFSPIQIASYLCMWKGLPDKTEIDVILSQLSALERQISADNLSIEEMNQTFTQDEFRSLIAEITANTRIALDLIKQSEILRTRRASL